MKNYFKKLLARWGFLHPSLGIKISQEKKAELLLAHKKALKTFVETGTRNGWMLERIGENFEKVYSIELDENLHRENAEKFKSNPNVKLFQGDSAVKLKEVLKEVNEPALFWLDAHGSGAINESNAPIISELGAIFNHMVKNHAILIDDARHFTLPTIEKMSKMAKQNNYTFEIENGIFRILSK